MFFLAFMAGLERGLIAEDPVDLLRRKSPWLHYKKHLPLGRCFFRFYGGTWTWPDSRRSCGSFAAEVPL